MTTTAASVLRDVAHAFTRRAHEEALLSLTDQQRLLRAARLTAALAAEVEAEVTAVDIPSEWAAAQVGV